MTSKQTITGQKFFRRTSRSPWESSINTTHHECDQSLNNLHENSLGSSQGGNSRITIKGQFPISISAIFDQLNPGQKRGLNQYYVGSDRKAPNSSFVASSPKLVKNSQQIKLTYIPIQTMATLETLPGGSKKGLDNSETKGRMIKNEQQKYMAELEKTKKQLCAMRIQNNQLQSIIMQKNQQNSKLANENNFIRDNAMHLQCQLRRVSVVCNEMEFRIQQDQRIIENVNRQLLAAIQSKLKQEQKARNIAQSMRRVQQQLKLRTEMGKQLQRIVEIKQKQILELKRNENINYQNSMNKQKQNRVLKQVSLLKQNNKICDKQNTVKKATRNKQNMQRSQQKYNRFIQTDSCPLEQCLRNNQYLTHLLEQKQKIIMDRNIEINELSFEMKNYEQIKDRIYQCEILIEELNSDRMANLAVRLAAKYKYY